jgi:hypothetical protein
MLSYGAMPQDVCLQQQMHTCVLTENSRLSYGSNARHSGTAALEDICEEVSCVVLKCTVLGNDAKQSTHLLTPQLLASADGGSTAT